MTTKRIKPERVAPNHWRYRGFNLIRRMGKLDIIDSRPVLVNRKSNIFECRDWIDAHLARLGEKMAFQERLNRC
jgi:hypothetical protein